MRTMWRELAPALALVPMVLGACSAAQPVPDSSYNDERWKGNSRAFVSSGFTMAPGTNAGLAKGTSALTVNPYLWRGALDTLGAAPLASVDSTGGVIITDWWAPPGAGPDVRVKTTAFVSPGAVAPASVRVTMFRQALRGGQWVDQPAVSAATTDEVQARIIARAQELSTQATASE
jgi:hypothetical protein